MIFFSFVTSALFLLQFSVETQAKLSESVQLNIQKACGIDLPQQFKMTPEQINSGQAELARMCRCLTAALNQEAKPPLDDTSANRFADLISNSKRDNKIDMKDPAQILSNTYIMLLDSPTVKTCIQSGGNFQQATKAVENDQKHIQHPAWGKLENPISALDSTSVQAANTKNNPIPALKFIAFPKGLVLNYRGIPKIGSKDLKVFAGTAYFANGSMIHAKELPSMDSRRCCVLRWLVQSLQAPEYRLHSILLP